MVIDGVTLVLIVPSVVVNDLTSVPIDAISEPVLSDTDVICPAVVLPDFSSDRWIVDAIAVRLLAILRPLFYDGQSVT